MSKVRKCRNNIVTFNVEFHNVGNRWNNMTNCKRLIIYLKLKETQYFELQIKIILN